MIPTAFDYRTIRLLSSDKDNDVICFDKNVELQEPVKTNVLEKTKFGILRFDINSVINTAYKRNRDCVQKWSIRPTADSILEFANYIRGKSHIVLKDIQISQP